MSHRRSHALLLTAAVIWGWTFVATKVALEELGPVELFALRLAIGLPVLGAVLVIKRIPLRFSREDAVPLVAGGVILAGHFLIQIVGLVSTTATAKPQANSPKNMNTRACQSIAARGIIGSPRSAPSPSGRGSG